MRRQGGYTLVELVLVLLIFGVVMALISASFSRIVTGSGQVMKSVETDIGGLIGLELMRLDLGLAGLGLPWSLGRAQHGGEAKAHLVAGLPGTNASLFNDDFHQAPRPFVLANGKGLNGSDYLVLKGSALGMTPTARGWSYLNYSSSAPYLKPAGSELELAHGRGDRVIVVRNGVAGGEPVRELVTDGSTFFCNLDDIPKAFHPKNREERYLVYGIAPAPEKSDDSVTDPDDTVTFPFNRADYYLAPRSRPEKPDTLPSPCAPGTGVLYRGLVSQQGNMKPLPILDCVADLQVVFLLDTSNDGGLVPQDLEAYDKAARDDGKDVARAIREHVMEVRVYILAQQGRKDPTYSHPVPDPERALVVGDRTWKESELLAAFGADWRRYRWRLYTISVQPKNLR